MSDAPKPNAIGALATHYAKYPAVRALLNLVPGWGSADTLLQQRAEELRHERLTVFFDELATGSVPLTEELIQSHDFLHCFFKTISAVVRTRRKEKIEMFARLLCSSAEPARFSSLDEYEEFLSIVDDVSFREFGVLTQLREFERAAEGTIYPTTVARIEGYWEEFREQACQLFKISPKVFGPFMTRLERTALFTRDTGAFWDEHPGFGHTTDLFERLSAIVRGTMSSDSIIG